MSDFVGEDRTLNDEQQEAVKATRGPVLVVAGAGTGKTTVIVERLCRLLGAGAEAKRVLALTFTEKAAAEMLDRVNQALDTYELELPIMTFNAYGEMMLRRYAADIGLNRKFTVMGESAQAVFLKERIDELGLDYFAPLSRPDGQLGELAAHFSLLKQSVITPEMYHKYVKAMKGAEAGDKLDHAKYQELAHAYEAYLRLCREANVIDYDDQIYLFIELLRLRPNVLREVQASYDYIMVDEFQDTNVMQSTLIDLLAAPRQNLFVVGDDDQSIYGWRGATLANILDFKDRYPKLKEITLVKNYRSTAQILDSAYRLIQHNNPHRLEERLHINKRLVSERSGPEPEVCVFKTLDEELAWIAEDIKRRLDAGTPPGSIAVMARRNVTTELLHSHLEYLGVEHIVAGQRYDLYQHPAVRMLLEALRAVADPLDNTSLYHTLIGPLFSLPATLIGTLASHMRRTHEPLEKMIQESTEDDYAGARQAVSMIRSWRDKIGTATVGQLAYEVLASSGYKDQLYKAGESDAFAVTAANRLSDLFKTMREFEQVALVPSVVNYVEALPALQAAGEGGQDSTLDLSGQLVNVLTVHKAKGLEWPIVYIADCTEGSFPLRESFRGLGLPSGLAALHQSEADAHLPEERRLMYVAMTRAKDELILTHAEKHSGSTVRKPSRFLGEAYGARAFTPRTASGPSSLSTIGFHGLEPSGNVSLPASILNGDQVQLTVSQIRTYLDCPLDFYYRYILNIPEEPNPMAQYGSLMHGLIETMNRGLMHGVWPKLADLQQQLSSEWPKAGYLSARHRDRAYQQAGTTLTNLYERLTAEHRVPLAVEEPFSFMLKDIGLKVRGRFDAVLPLGSGVEIVDYKTSTSADSPEKAKARASASQQLTFYAMAWQRLHDELPALVTLDFIDTGMRGSLKKTQRGIDSAYVRLQTVADGIRAGHFQPGRDHTFCAHPKI
jgi:DNA helicase-2/ATP-dependent DNA helicase PcrA